MIESARLESLLDRFASLKLGLVGDLFLDRYLEITPGVEEMSIETGLEAYQVSRVRNSPGALGTVMNNLVALGVGNLCPVSVIGDDGHGDDLLRELAKLSVATEHLIRDPNRLTPTYTKPLKQDADGQWQELNRLDVRSRSPLSEQMTGRLCEQLREVFDATDGLIVLDQVCESDWGVVNASVRDCLVELSRQHPDKLIFVDSRSHIGSFESGVLKPNLDECLAASGLSQADRSASDLRQAKPAATKLAAQTGRPVFCTLGQNGILVANPSGDADHVRGYPVTGPVDIVGAGDSATAGIVSSLLAGASLTEAATVGNLVASITVQQLGTTGTASPEAVLARWREMWG